MDTKRMGIAAAILAVGVGGLLWQLHIIQTEGYYYKFGMLCSVAIVVGIAALFLNINDLTAEDENGKQQSLSFSDMPTAWKITLVLGGLAGIAQLIYFENGAPGL